ncbi:hypothetical protein [Chengkuizengella marina]|uniref:Uncharacterized protein n=1 Tax=Chengkuizengella marina TaxID=2507566 RepID=A0A6N9Q8J7_9BACL|nr:hypothetical protein [Chengkuizengella marina]NBI31060.1 hypothetical protein [Chengkuizengella marina]
MNINLVPLLLIITLFGLIAYALLYVYISNRAVQMFFLNKNVKNAIILICIFIIVMISIFNWQLNKENEDLKYRYGNEIQFQHIILRNVYHDSHAYLIELLNTNDKQLRQELLEKIYIELRTSNTHLLFNLDHEFGFSYGVDFESFHWNFSDFVKQLKEKNPSESFTNLELEQIELVLQYLKVFDEKLMQLKVEIIESKEWANIYEQPIAQKILTELAEELSSLPEFKVK